MKALKITGIVIVVLAIVFWSIGVIVPTFTYHSKVEVQAPIELCWDVMMDESQINEWLPTLVDSKTIEGEPLTVGSVHEMTFVEGSDTIVMLETVQEFQPPTTFEFIMENEVIWSYTAIRLEALGEKTVIHSTNRVSGQSAFWKSLFAMMQGTFEEKNLENYMALKAVIERQ